MDQFSLFLEDYLDKPDFAASFLCLAGNIATTGQLPARIDEIGLVCRSVKEAADFLEKNYKGMHIFFLGEGSPALFIENGKSTPFTTRLGFGYYKGVILELAEPGIGSEVFGQTPIIDGKIMINHLGFKARGPQLKRKTNSDTVLYAGVMKKLGAAQRVEAEINIFGFMAHVHIFETMHMAHGVEIEFLDFRLFSARGLKMPYPWRLIALVAWFQKNIGPRFLQMKADHPLPPEGK